MTRLLVVFSVIWVALLLPSCSSDRRDRNKGDQATAGEIGSVAVFAGTLEIRSNDVKRSHVDIPLSGETVDGSGEVANIPVRTDKVTSNGFDVSWGERRGLDEVRVLIFPEPVPPTVAPEVSWVAGSLPGNATSFHFDQLAAAVDVFVRVEGRIQGRLAAVGQSHARTRGGPRIKLVTPLREVHLYAPHILMLVLENKKVHSYTSSNNWWDAGVDEIIGYNGESWQSGTWTVSRADSSSIGISAVYRHSTPVGQFYQEPGYNAHPHFELLDVDHQIFLVLREPVGLKEVLIVTHSPGEEAAKDPRDPYEGTRSTQLDVVIPYSDRYLETPVIQVNQVGYSPKSKRRYAYVSGWMGDGEGLSLDSFPSGAGVLLEPLDPMEARETVVSSLAVAARSAFNDEVGAKVREIDLATVPQNEGGRYRVRIPGVGVSWPTAVSETAVFKAFYVASRGLYFNRWGRELEMPYTDWAPRPADHPTVFTGELQVQGHSTFFEPGTPLVGERPLVGGHHDAGDYDIAPVHFLIAQNLLATYEMNPKAFSDGQLTIPESGNGIPDILDEALWSIAGWEQLQESDGGVRMGVESYRHPHVGFADQDDLPYWTYARHPEHSMRLAGLFAQAARLVAPFDLTRSQKLHARAERAFEYALASGIGEDLPGSTALGASQLLRLTGREQYKALFEATWNRWDAWGQGMAFRQEYPWCNACLNREDGKPMGAMIEHIIGYVESDQADLAIVEQATNRMASLEQTSLDAVENNHPHRNGRPVKRPPTWGKGSVVGEYVNSLFNRLRLGNVDEATRQDYIDAVSLSADYVLGCNPLGRVWITQLGSRPPEDPLHLDSKAFFSLGEDIIPGFPVFGPTKGIRWSGGYQFGARLGYPAFVEDGIPMMRHYQDVSTNVVNNEGGSIMMTSHVRLFSALLSPGMSPPSNWLPGNLEHRNRLAPHGAGVIPNPPVPPF